MFRTICIEFKLASVPYFLDEMREYEASSIIKYLEFADRTNKELVRYQLLVAINSVSKHKVEVKDIMKLPWDDKYLDKLENAYNEDEAKYLETQSEEYENILNNKLYQFEEVDMMKS